MQDLSRAIALDTTLERAPLIGGRILCRRWWRSLPPIAGFANIVLHFAGFCQETLSGSAQPAHSLFEDLDDVFWILIHGE